MDWALKLATEKAGSDDFIPLWAGQAAGLLKETHSAQSLTEEIIHDAFKFLQK